MASASGYNHHRFARAVLKKSRKWEPSLAVQLFPTHWRFENSPVNFQYDGPMKPFLMALRSQVIPTSLVPFLYDITPPVSFVDGCLVVELQDFRRNPEVRSRVVMRPAAETLAQTIDVMLERKGLGDEQLALELESRILAATSAPLYLGTSILATRNAVLALNLTSPAGPSLSADGNVRSPSSMMEAESKSSLDRMRKLLGAGSGSSAGNGGAPFQPNWSILRLKERLESIQLQREREREARALASQNAMTNGEETRPGTSGGGAPAQQGEVEKKKPKKKRPPPPADEEEEKKETKPKKKKKTAAAAAAAAEVKAETAGTTATKDSAPAPAPAPKKKKAPAKKDDGAAAATATAAATSGPAPDKPKKKKAEKKKDDEGLSVGVGLS